MEITGKVAFAMVQGSSEGKSSKQIALDDDSVERIADAIIRKPGVGVTRLGESTEKWLGTFRNNLKFHHKVIYALMIFLGLVLVWYGLWSIISVIPVLNKPFVALAAGITVLALTGAFFKELG